MRCFSSDVRLLVELAPSLLFSSQQQNTFQPAGSPDFSHSPVCKLARYTAKAPPHKLCTDDKTIPFPRNLKCEQTTECK